MSVMWIRTQSSNTIDAFRRGMVLFTATILFALALVPSLAATPILTFGDDVIPAGRKADTVAIISIHGPIDGITRHSLERRLEAAVAEGAADDARVAAVRPVKRGARARRRCRSRPRGGPGSR